MPLETHPDLEIISIIVEVEGKEPNIILVKGQDSVDVVIPGGVKYTMTLQFKVLNNKFENFTYKQNVKKLGVTVRSREVDMGTFEPSDEVYSYKFPPDETPGGWMMRGKYQAVSTYFANGKQLIANDWTLEITA
ncbi:unnamed protein product [Candida verbasci]|uniref:Rho GDP-dissociation inhibitor n=1 Tax=Candida verbasci TaxID=1227364 RepID=A0A9W4TTT1_9ASCO|nr:unnamed protein product [Candida verbasci]